MIQYWTLASYRFINHSTGINIMKDNISCVAFVFSAQRELSFSSEEPETYQTSNPDLTA